MSRQWRWVVVPVAVVGAGAAAFVVGDDETDHPEAWDERIVDLVSFVEDERGLTFEHPVTVDFLDEAAWEEQADIDEEDVLDEEAQLLEHGEGMFRALGLAEGDLDLLASSEEIGASGTVGLYLFDEERITVRGEDLSLRVQATLVHELTHVLQDQHYDVGDRLQALGESDGPSPEGSLRVLVEGDADRIEDAWRATLSGDDLAALEELEQSEGDAAEASLDELPASLVTFFASDYILGGGFVGIVEADGGQDAIDDAFLDPPGPDEHVLNPLSYLRDDEREEVEPPEVPGEPIEDLEGEFGAVSLFLMLAERTDPVTALAAVDGWGGDAYRAYTADDRTCVALAVRGEEPDDAGRLLDALEAWAEAMPTEARASASSDGADIVELTVCDPGADADLVDDAGGRSQATISLPATRAVLARDVLEGQGSLEQAACFSTGILNGLPFEIITAEVPTPEQQAEIERVAGEQVAACR